MTPDEIETAAIEAALRKFSVGILAAMGETPEAANAQFEKELHTSDPEKAAQLAELRGITVEAIRAYERAMWRPIEEVIPVERERLWVKTPRADGEAHWLDDDDKLKLYWANMGPGEYVDGLIDDATHFRPLPRREGE